MSGAVIAQLLITLGPVALRLLPKLSEIWSKELTPLEVLEFTKTSEKTYEEYIAEAKARLNPPVI